MYLLHGQKIDTSRDLRVGDIIYPAASLRDATTRASIGIVEAPDPIAPDARIYFFSERGDGQFETVARDLDEVKAIASRNVRATAGVLMTATGLDWMVQRNARKGTPIPQNVLDFCAAVDDACDKAVAAIEAAKTGEAIVAVVPAWPVWGL